MVRQNMPAAEVEIDSALVRHLLESQRPDLAEAEIAPLSFGWDNVSFRIGASRVARLPRREMAAGLIENEATWLPELAPRLPLPVPAMEFLGEASGRYPWRWLITPFISGEPAGTVPDLDVTGCATQIGGFLAALHRPAPANAPHNPFRGGPLNDRDETTRQRFAALHRPADRARLSSLWDESLTAEPFDGAPVWLHGDLHPQNLLVTDGTLSGVIDFGDITSGDPATDLVVAWSLVGKEHELFWDAYGSTAAALRLRARGWAISLGLAYVANSADNPAMESIGEETLQAVLDLS
ncbi:MAG TPA: aminoglycoside phosphotransferase family protein [Acidimicrobiia bacterium]